MLTEKGTQRIIITVRKQVDKDQIGAKEESADNVVDGQDKQDGTKGATSRQRSANWWKTQLTHSLAVAKQYATLRLQYEIAGLGVKYGDQTLQNAVDRKVEQVTDVSNIATSVAMGATYGATGGPLGAAVGALMMGTQTAMTTAFKYKTRQRDYDVEVFKQNNAIEYKRARAQVNLTTGRLR